MPDATEPTTEETQETTPGTEAAPEAIEAPEAQEEGEAEAAGAEPETDGEGESEGEEPAAETAGQKEEKRRRSGGWVRKLERAERRAEQAERERSMLLEQIAAGRPQQPAGPVKEPTPDERAAEYIDSLVEQRIQAREAQTQQQKTVAEFNQRTQAVRAEVEDFDDVIASASHIQVPMAVRQVLLTSPVGPKIMYQLAKSPAELARISALPPLDAAREIGRLEANASSTPTPKAQPKSAFGKAADRGPAPAPITPVAARGPTTVKRTEDMNFEEYKAWRNSHGKR